MTNQLRFKSRNEYVNWRRQWRDMYREGSAAIKTLKSCSRDMNISEMQRQQAGKTLNSAKCMARSMMMSLDAAKMMYTLDGRKLPPRIKNKPTEEQIQQRREAKHGAQAKEETKETVTN